MISGLAHEEVNLRGFFILSCSFGEILWLNTCAA